MVTSSSVGRSGQALTGEVPSELVVFNHGMSRTARGRTFRVDRRASNTIIAAFRRAGHDLVVDREHATVDPRARDADGTAPAFGWIKGLHWDDRRGLVARVDWTQRGYRAVAARELRYHSPCFRLDADGRVCGLLHVGLTNTPAILDTRPIVASRFAPPGEYAIGQPCLLVCNRSNDMIPSGESDGGVLGAIQAFAGAVDWQGVQEALAAQPEAFVTLVGDSFEGDNARILGLLTRILERLGQGVDPIGVAGEMMETEVSAASRRTQPMATATLGHRGPYPVKPKAGAARSEIIVAAQRSFVSATAPPAKMMVCSEKSWVNLALRESGQKPLTEAEIAEQSLRDD